MGWSEWGWLPSRWPSGWDGSRLRNRSPWRPGAAQISFSNVQAREATAGLQGVPAPITYTNVQAREAVAGLGTTPAQITYSNVQAREAVAGPGARPAQITYSNVQAREAVAEQGGTPAQITYTTSKPAKRWPDWAGDRPRSPTRTSRFAKRHRNVEPSSDHLLGRAGPRHHDGLLVRAGFAETAWSKANPAPSIGNGRRQFAQPQSGRVAVALIRSRVWSSTASAWR